MKTFAVRATVVTCAFLIAALAIPLSAIFMEIRQSSVADITVRKVVTITDEKTGRQWAAFKYGSQLIVLGEKQVD